MFSKEKTYIFHKGMFIMGWTSERIHFTFYEILLSEYSNYVGKWKGGSSNNKISILEIILIADMVEAKEWDSICHHPNVTASTVVVGFVPLSVLISNCQNLLFLHSHVARIYNFLVKTCNYTNLLIEKILRLRSIRIWNNITNQ